MFRGKIYCKVVGEQLGLTAQTNFKRVMDRLWWYLSFWIPELWFSNRIMKKNPQQVLSRDLRMSTHGLCVALEAPGTPEHLCRGQRLAEKRK